MEPLVRSAPDDPMHPDRDIQMNWMIGCAKTRYAGIFKIKNGYRVRVRAVDPRTGMLKEANREYGGSI